MVVIQKHENCECEKYSPVFDQFQIRLNGENYLCRTCNRYVDPKKWKGGLVEKPNHSRGKGTVMKKIGQSYCPCCRTKMARTRIAKKKLIRSFEKQTEQILKNAFIKAQLPAKRQFLQKISPISTQHE